MSEVEFTWKGKKYTVKQAVYTKDYIVLPNRQVIRSTCHSRSGSPARLSSLEEVPHHLEHAPVGEIAEHMGNAILASEVD
jgi:hypothetical protein